MRKYTKGEWVSFEIEETGEFAIFSLNTFIAQTQNPMVNEEPTKSEKRSNAKLMASAPEMLEALKMIIDYHDRDRDNETDLHFENARNVIAKAEGDMK